MMRSSSKHVRRRVPSKWRWAGKTRVWRRGACLHDALQPVDAARREQLRHLALAELAEAVPAPRVERIGGHGEGVSAARSDALDAHRGERGEGARHGDGGLVAVAERALPAAAATHCDARPAEEEAMHVAAGDLYAAAFIGRQEDVTRRFLRLAPLVAAPKVRDEVFTLLLEF